MAAPQPTLGLRDRNKLRLRGELLEAVLDLFADENPNALNVEAVAQKAGCSKATVYVYFPGGLNEMLCAIYADISDEVYAEAMQLHGEASNVLERLKGLAKPVLDMSARPRRGKFFAHLDPQLSPALQPVMGRTSGRMEATMARDLADVVGPDAAIMAVFLVGALREASVRIAKDPACKNDMRDGFTKLVQTLIASQKVTR